jgi:CheY-like chemotaxis protein
MWRDASGTAMAFADAGGPTAVRVNGRNSIGRILIVEDEVLIAQVIEETLRDAGFLIAGRTGSPDEAIAIVEESGCDAAVLDVNLRGRSVAPVATALHQRGTPFVFISGYGGFPLHEQFRDAPLLSKPFRYQQLIDVIKKILP